jgi:hypothetical protein
MDIRGRCFGSFSPFKMHYLSGFENTSRALPGMADAEAHSFEDEEQRKKRTSVRDRGSDEVFGRMGPAGALSRLELRGSKLGQLTAFAFA